MAEVQPQPIEERALWKLANRVLSLLLSLPRDQRERVLRAVAEFSDVKLVQHRIGDAPEEVRRA